MESDERVGMRRIEFRLADFIGDRGFLRDGKKVSERVNHYVADEIDALAMLAFAYQIFDGVFFGDEEIVGKRVGDDAIDFFGHGAIAAAQAGFHMHHGDEEFGGGERGGHRGIDVADDQHAIGFAFEDDRLDLAQNFRSLPGVGAGADFEIYVRLGDAHLAEENVGKFFVVMLPGVHEDGLDFRMAAHLAEEWRDFNEIGASAYDIKDAHSGLRHVNYQNSMGRERWWLAACGDCIQCRNGDAEKPRLLPRRKTAAAAA